MDQLLIGLIAGICALVLIITLSAFYYFWSSKRSHTSRGKQVDAIAGAQRVKSNNKQNCQSRFDDNSWSRELEDGDSTGLERGACPGDGVLVANEDGDLVDPQKNDCMTAFLDLDEQQIQDLSPEKKYDYERLEMIKRTYGQLIPDAEVRKWSPEKIKKIDLETLYKLTKKQIENLTTRQWEAMTEKAKDDIKFKQYNYHLVWKKRRHLGDSLLINKELEDAVSSWSPATIASLPVEKLKWLNLHYIVTVMTTEQLQALAENINYVHFLRHRRDEMEREASNPVFQQ
jgi:hypothetical protein